MGDNGIGSHIVTRTKGANVNCIYSVDGQCGKLGCRCSWSRCNICKYKKTSITPAQLKKDNLSPSDVDKVDKTKKNQTTTIKKPKVPGSSNWKLVGPDNTKKKKKNKSRIIHTTIRPQIGQTIKCNGKTGTVFKVDYVNHTFSILTSSNKKFKFIYKISK